MIYSTQEVERAMANAKNGCASESDKRALAHMANSGQAGSKTRDCKSLLEKANNQRR